MDFARVEVREIGHRSLWNALAGLYLGTVTINNCKTLVVRERRLAYKVHTVSKNYFCKLDF